MCAPPPPGGSRCPHPGSSLEAGRSPCELQNGNNEQAKFFSTGKSSLPAWPLGPLFARGGGGGAYLGEGRETNLGVLRGAIAAPSLPLAVSLPQGAGRGRSIPRRWDLPGGKATGKGSIGPCSVPERCLGQCGAGGGFSASPADVAPRSFQMICWFCNT